MMEVEVVAKFDTDRDEVARLLTPERIMECEQTYELIKITETSNGWTARAVPRGDDRKVIAEFNSISNGYEYWMSEGGYFEDLYTRVTIRDEVSQVVDDPVDTKDGVVVVMRSEFTFGGVLAPLIDSFAIGKREKELKRALFRMGKLLDDSENISRE